MAQKGTIVVTTSKVGPLSKYSCAWTSHASDGVVEECAVGLPTGMLVQAISTPGATTPSDDFDVTLLTEDGEDDLLGGGGADCSNSLTKVCKLPSATLNQAPVWLVAGTYWLTIAAAGNSKTGVFDIFIA